MYYRCKKCDGIFVHPVQAQDFYLKTKTYLNNIKGYMSLINPYGQRWIAEQFERLYKEKMQTNEKGTLFEVGSGVGYLTLVTLARGWTSKGIETSKDAVQYANKNLKVDITLSTIEDYKTEETFDAIIMVEVLEHFIDPLKSIEALRKLSKTRTLLFGTTPNTDSEHWQRSKQNIYVPKDHIFLFNTKSLQNFADKAGVEDLTIEYFGSGEKHDSNLMYAGVLTPSKS